MNTTIDHDLSTATPRAILHRTRGTTHGPITRLMSPGDLGEALKPFVFLDLVDVPATASPPKFGFHPHSGIATLTFAFTGDVAYEDTTGAKGVLPAGGVEWMRAGNGVWHTGAPVDGTRFAGFQLWIALPEAQENLPAESIYLDPTRVPMDGPARVLLGRSGAAQSPIPAPASMNYLAVTLKDGERWRYVPGIDHDLSWVAVAAGRLQAGEAIARGELAIFDGAGAIDFTADGETSFVVGSAAKHPHDLVMGRYSVHTSAHALAKGEAEIGRIGRLLRGR